MKERLGILGGMGPLASAEFLGTLYRLNITDPEQEAPVCILISDPSLPDRTSAILCGDTRDLAARLAAALADLAALGADRIVIACVTAHHVLDQVPPLLRRKVVSLIDLMIDEMIAVPRRRLLLTTNGTRAAGIFELHARWHEIAQWVERPSIEDQDILHELIYRLKRGDTDQGGIDWLADLPSRYGVDGCIFGCTELHLIHQALAGEMGAERVLDPLVLVARALPSLMSTVKQSTAFYFQKTNP
jgi:aspartate racemase